MDILKIRKKQKAAQDAEAAAEPEAVEVPQPAAEPPAPARTPAPAAKKAAPSKPPAPTPPSSPAAPKSVAPKAAAPQSAPSPRPAAAKAAPKKERLPSVEADDPLLEFLARYDEGDDHSVAETLPDAPRDEVKRYLAFDLANEEYAASIMEIREILRVLSLTPVPRAPPEILGVISKRGLVMPVVDLAATLGLRAPEHRWAARQRILVVGEADRVCGLRVDRVLEVVRLRAGDVEEVPASLGARSRHQLRGLGRVGDRLFSLLDIPAVLHGMAVAAGLESHEEVA